MTAAIPYDRARLLQWLGFRALAALLLFCAALAAWAWSGVLLASKTLTFEQHAEYYLSLLGRNLVMYVPIYLAVALADGVAVRGPRRLALLAVALLAGGLAAVQVRCAAMPDQLLWVYGSIQMPYCTTFPTWRAYFDFPNIFLTPLMTSCVVMIFLFNRRRDAALVTALRTASAAQIEARRQRIESEMAAMHSRVDPDGLLATLRAIRERYEQDPREGESALDELIHGLREAAGRPAPLPGAAE